MGKPACLHFIRFLMWFVITASLPPISTPVASAAQTASANPWLKKLPGGAEVEFALIGVRFDKDAPWWRPDGTLVTKPDDVSFMARLIKGSMNPEGSWPENPNQRELYFRVRDAGVDADKGPFDCSYVTFKCTGDAKKDGAGTLVTGPRTVLMAATVFPLQTSQTLRVGVASGKWQVIDTWKPGPKPEPRWVNGRATIFEAAKALPGGETQLAVAHNRVRDGVKCRLVAIRKADHTADIPGCEEDTEGSHTWQTVRTRFHTALNEIEEFQLQSVAWQWAEFPVPAFAASKPPLPFPKSGIPIAPAGKPSSVSPAQETKRAALQQALADLEREKSLAALRRLLKANGQDEMMVERIGCEDAASPAARNIGKEGVRRIKSNGQVVVHARTCQPIPPDKRKLYPQGLGVALLFSYAGYFEGKLGGEWGEDGGDEVSTGPISREPGKAWADRWITLVSRPLHRGEFTQRTDMHLLLARLPLGARIFSTAGQWEWIDGAGGASTKQGLRLSGAVAAGSQGLGADGRPCEPAITWEGRGGGQFHGPSRFSVQGKPVFEVDLNHSPEFVASDRPRPTFEELYRLDAAEALRRVPPPFVAERGQFIFEHTVQRNGIQNTNPSAVIFDWDGKLSLENQFNAPLLEGLLLTGVFKELLGLNRYEYEGDEQLLQTKVGGDWIVRRDAALERKMAGLSDALSGFLGGKLRFEKRRVEREVIVATGRFEYHNLPEPARPDSIYLYTAPDMNERWRRSSGEPGKNADEFLTFLGDRLNLRVINKTETREMPRLYYHLVDLPAAGDEAALDRCLQNITAQTGFQFKREHHQLVDVWTIRIEK